ncbi:MAG: Tetratricopeptide 1 repeat-containing protein [Cyanobacteria bacterium RYN_339]|nr:Tetratricopeptide 1 repeat-containing protein [Cyanobacteria bacterium RYN_339]
MSQPLGVKARLAAYLKTLAAGGQGEPAHDHIAEGLRAWEAGEHVKAATALTAGLVAQPSNLDARIALTRVYLAQRHLDRAEAHATTAATLHSENPAAHSLMGEVLQALRRYDKADSAYRTAIKLGPKFVEAHVRLGILQFEQNYMDEALKTLEAAIFLNQKDANARYYIAQICIENEDFKRALIQSHWAEKIDPSFRPIYLLRADIFEHLDDWRNAAAELDKLVGLGKAEADIFCRLGVARLRLKDEVAAQEAFEAAVEVQWYCLEAHYHLAQLLEGQQKLDQAQEKYKLLVESRLYTAVAHEALNRIQETLAAIDDNLIGEDTPVAGAAPGLPPKPKLADLVGRKPGQKPPPRAAMLIPPAKPKPPLPAPPPPAPVPNAQAQMLQMQLVMALFMEMQGGQQEPEA